MSAEKVIQENPIWGALREKYGDAIDTLSKEDLLELSRSGDGETNLTMEDVKRCRLANGMTQRKFASMFGIPFGTYIQWESGRRTPPPYVISMMSKYWSFAICFKEAGLMMITPGAYLEMSEGRFDMLKLQDIGSDKIVTTKEHTSGTIELANQKRRYHDFTNELVEKSMNHLD